MVKCENCKYFSATATQAYPGHVVGTCNWNNSVALPIVWKKMLFGSFWVWSDIEHECETHEPR
jgi:hypothetical protein